MQGCKDIDSQWLHLLLLGVQNTNLLKLPRPSAIPSANSEPYLFSLVIFTKIRPIVHSTGLVMKIPCCLYEVPVAHSRIQHEMLDNGGSIHQ